MLLAEAVLVLHVTWLPCKLRPLLDRCHKDVVLLNTRFAQGCVLLSHTVKTVQELGVFQ